MVYKEKGSWYIRGKIKDFEGKYCNYHRKTQAKTKAEAMECERKFRLTFQLKEDTKEQPTFEQLSKNYLEHKKNQVKESTILTDMNVLNKLYPKIGTYKIGMLTKKLLQDMINDFDKQYSKQYVSKIYYTIRKILEYAVKQDMIEVNPMNKVYYDLRKNEVKKEMLFYEPDEFNIFIEYMDDEFKNFFMFLYYMGTRKAEAQALTWLDVDFKASTVRINKTMTEKTTQGVWAITAPKTRNSIRNIAMPQIIVDMLKEAKEQQKKIFGFSDDCFVFGMIKPLSSETLRRKKNEAVKKANDDGNDLKTIRIHDFRHSHVSYLVNNKSNRYSDYDIANRLGDTVATIQETYAHMFKESGKKISDFINEDLKQNKQQVSAVLPFEQLKQLKELLDLEIITQQEFDNKKMELLGKI